MAVAAVNPWLLVSLRMWATLHFISTSRMIRWDGIFTVLIEECYSNGYVICWQLFEIEVSKVLMGVLATAKMEVCRCSLQVSAFAGCNWCCWDNLVAYSRSALQIGNHRWSMQDWKGWKGHKRATNIVYSRLFLNLPSESVWHKSVEKRDSNQRQTKPWCHRTSLRRWDVILFWR